MMKRTILAALLVVCALAVPVKAADYYIVPDSLTAGPVKFTETYPKVAARQAHHSQFHSNPYTFVYCGSQSFSTNVADKTSTADGFEGTTYPVTLPAGDCSASIVYFVNDQTGVHSVWVASVDFTLTD